MADRNRQAHYNSPVQKPSLLAGQHKSQVHPTPPLTNLAHWCRVACCAWGPRSGRGCPAWWKGPGAAAGSSGIGQSEIWHLGSVIDRQFCQVLANLKYDTLVQWLTGSFVRYWPIWNMTPWFSDWQAVLSGTGQSEIWHLGSVIDRQFCQVLANLKYDTLVQWLTGSFVRYWPIWNMTPWFSDWQAVLSGTGQSEIWHLGSVIDRQFCQVLANLKYDTLVQWLTGSFVRYWPIWNMTPWFSDWQAVLSGTGQSEIWHLGSVIDRQFCQVLANLKYDTLVQWLTGSFVRYWPIWNMTPWFSDWQAVLSGIGQSEIWHLGSVIDRQFCQVLANLKYDTLVQWLTGSFVRYWPIWNMTPWFSDWQAVLSGIGQSEIWHLGSVIDRQFCQVLANLKYDTLVQWLTGSFVRYWPIWNMTPWFSDWQAVLSGTGQSEIWHLGSVIDRQFCQVLANLKYDTLVQWLTGSFVRYWPIWNMTPWFSDWQAVLSGTGQSEILHLGSVIDRQFCQVLASLKYYTLVERLIGSFVRYWPIWNSTPWFSDWQAVLSGIGQTEIVHLGSVIDRQFCQVLANLKYYTLVKWLTGSFVRYWPIWNITPWLSDWQAGLPDTGPSATHYSMVQSLQNSDIRYWPVWSTVQHGSITLKKYHLVLASLVI